MTYSATGELADAISDHTDAIGGETLAVAIKTGDASQHDASIGDETLRFDIAVRAT